MHILHGNLHKPEAHSSPEPQREPRSFFDCIGMHKPLAQVWPGLQDIPHDPQFLKSVDLSTHALPHFGSFKIIFSIEGFLKFIKELVSY